MIGPSRRVHSLRNASLPLSYNVGGILTRLHAGLAPKQHQAQLSGRGGGGGRSSAISRKVSGSILRISAAGAMAQTRSTTDRAIQIGLIVNELVMNAVKYAFPGKAKGTVMVTLERAPGELWLTVADDGQRLDPRKADSPGSAAGWSTASPNSSAARSSGKAPARGRPWT